VSGVVAANLLIGRVNFLTAGIPGKYSLYAFYFLIHGFQTPETAAGQGRHFFSAHVKPPIL
jgi:hypothetical protein